MEYFNKPNIERGHDEREFCLCHTSAIECVLKQYLYAQCNIVGVVKSIIRNRFGQATEIALFCENFEEDIEKIFTSPRTDNSSKFIVNEKIVDAFSKIGSGHFSMETFCASLGMHM